MNSVESIGTSIAEFIDRNHSDCGFERSTVGHRGDIIRQHLDPDTTLANIAAESIGQGKIERLKPENAVRGDIIVHYYGKWQISYITGRKAFGYPLAVSDLQNPEWSFPKGSHSFRVAAGIDLKIPAHPDHPPKLFLPDRSPVITDMTDNDFGEILIRDPEAEITDRKYRLVRIGSLNEVEFEEGETAVLKNDYLYITKTGFPLIISDFHQKIPYAITELINLKLTPNQKPVVDYIDEHDDGNTSRNGIFYYNRQKINSVTDLKEIIRNSDCGQAAALLQYTGIADVRFLSDFSWVKPPSWGKTINPFNYKQPFARESKRPHILSYEADHIGGLYQYLYMRHNYPFEQFRADYFNWLKKHGVNKSNYDAAIFYTGAPNYAYKAHAEKYLRNIADLFE